MSEALRRWPPSLRLSAVTLWSSFVGAVMMLLLLLVLAPELEEGHFHWPVLGIWFLLSWLASLVPVVFALSLAPSPDREPQQ